MSREKSLDKSVGAQVTPAPTERKSRRERLFEQAKQRFIDADPQDMSPKAFFVMKILLRTCSPTGRCEPSIPEIAQAIGACDRTTQRALRELEELGWIATKLRRISYKLNDTNVYTILPCGRSANRPRSLRCPSERKARGANGDTSHAESVLPSGPPARAHSPSGFSDAGGGAADPDDDLPEGLKSPAPRWADPGEGEASRGVLCSLSAPHEQDVPIGFGDVAQTQSEGPKKPDGSGGSSGSDDGSPPPSSSTSGMGSSCSSSESQNPKGNESSSPDAGRVREIHEDVRGQVDDRTCTTREKLMGEVGGAPKGGAVAPSEIARARAGAHTTLYGAANIRHTLVTCGLSDLVGDGFERRLDQLRGRRGDWSEMEWCNLLASIGTRRAKILFDAADTPNKWAGDPKDVRGLVYRSMLLEKKPRVVELPEHKPREWKKLWDLPFREQLTPERSSLHVVEASDDEQAAHVPPAQPPSLANNAARKIMEALRAEYRGEKPLVEIAEMDDAVRFANDLSRLSEEAASGGRLTTDDILATIEHFAVYEALKIKRKEMQAPSVSLRNFLRRQIQNAKRGCAESKREQARDAVFFKKKQVVDTRQPGDLKHVGKPIPPLTEERKANILAALRGKTTP